MEWIIPTSCIFGPTYEEKIDAIVNDIIEERNKTNGQTTKNS